MNNLGLENFKRKFDEQEFLMENEFLIYEQRVSMENWATVGKVMAGISIVGILLALIKKLLGKNTAESKSTAAGISNKVSVDKSNAHAVGESDPIYQKELQDWKDNKAELEQAVAEGKKEYEEALASDNASAKAKRIDPFVIKIKKLEADIAEVELKKHDLLNKYNHQVDRFLKPYMKIDAHVNASEWLSTYSALKKHVMVVEILTHADGNKYKTTRLESLWIWTKEGMEFYVDTFSKLGTFFKNCALILDAISENITQNDSVTHERMLEPTFERWKKLLDGLVAHTGENFNKKLKDLTDNTDSNNKPIATNYQTWDDLVINDNSRIYATDSAKDGVVELDSALVKFRKIEETIQENTPEATYLHKVNAQILDKLKDFLIAHSKTSQRVDALIDDINSRLDQRKEMFKNSQQCITSLKVHERNLKDLNEDLATAKADLAKAESEQ